MLSRRVQVVSNSLVLAIIGIPFLALSCGAVFHQQSHTLEEDQVAYARSVQLAVKNYIYINHGQLPRAVYQKGCDRRDLYSFLPARRRLTNLATGQETEPRDWVECELNGEAERFAIYYRYQKSRYTIYCYGSDTKEPLLVLEGP